MLVDYPMQPIENKSGNNIRTKNAFLGISNLFRSTGFCDTKIYRKKSGKSYISKKIRYMTKSKNTARRSASEMLSTSFFMYR